MRHNLLISTLSSLLFNTAIAGLLTAISFGEDFWINLIFSQCIGLSIYAINVTVAYHVSDKRRRWMVLALTFPGSIVLGVTLASWIAGVGGWDDPRAWISVVIGFFFGGIGAITFFLGERIEQLDAEVRQRRLAEVEAQLKTLQAQIEPHFLFNTLANVSSLIDSDPALAKRLLERLNDWLRVTLAQTRKSSATLGDELDLLENYLQIMKIRFGDRLNWRIEGPEDARRSPFPPMLLQPLVENALRHGIEPKLGGGEIVVGASLGKGQLRVEVRDTGCGLKSGAGVNGTGLDNVSNRLSALFGEAGKLTLFGNAAGGATARLELPG